jgi:alpha-D-xyloside xylohydrolase
MGLIRTSDHTNLFRAEAGSLLWQYDAEKVRIDAWGEDGLRVRATQRERFEEESWALLERGETQAKIEITENFARITNGKITAEMTNVGRITFKNAEGRVLLQEYLRNRVDYSAEYCSALDIDAREFHPILGGDYELTARFESDPAEKLYGMGQYQQPYLNLKGCELELAQRNSQASVPFCVSSAGYGFLWNNPGVGSACFGKNLTRWHLKSAKQLDYWITAGDTPDEIERHYAGAAGTVPMMPDWAMGFWQCKLRYWNQRQLMEIAREYKRRGLPISVIVIDFFHWPSQGDWDFDDAYWPDPEGMIRELDEMGIRLMVSIWPTVARESVNYQEMLKKGYLIRTDRGLRYAMDFIEMTAHFDATNPDARRYVWEKAKKNYFDKGVSLFWLDEAEPEYGKYDFDLYRYHKGPNVQIGNVYPMCYAQGFFEGMREAGVENPINLLRCAWAGSQRYGALVWSGDIHSSFIALRNQLAAGLNMGLAGIPWWTTDIGGFHGGDPTDPAFRELLIRWFQYGAFCPVMRLHGCRVPEAAPVENGVGGGRCVTGADNEVWSFGEEAYGILENLLKLRERMKPYISRLMREAHEFGRPVIRTLFYEFPADPEAWNVEDQYLFGDALLIAPVLEAGQRARNVYLPKGCDWIDARRGAEYAGGQTVTADAPIESIPVFVRKGAYLGFAWA